MTDSRPNTHDRLWHLALISAGALTVGGVLAACGPTTSASLKILESPKHNAPDLYAAQSDGLFYSPFNLAVEPMERLLLVSFERDPDPVYAGFEPQVFDDPVSGKGMLIIAYRVDGRVDVYHQPGVNVTHKSFDVVGKGLSAVIERPLEHARFDAGPAGVDVFFAFEDRKGRPVEVTIRESGSKPVKPFGLLAPLGSSTVHPPYLPVFFLHDFYFVRRSGTRYEISIDGKKHRPDTLPLPMDGSRMYFTRYSADPLIASWNATHDGSLTPLKPNGAQEVRQDGVIYDIMENGGRYEIHRMRAGNGRHEIKIDFRPAVPDLRCLRDGARVEGRFMITGDASTGMITGDYQVERRGSEIKMRIHPSGGWQPNERKWIVRFIYRANRLFKTWPTKYVWTAKINLDGEMPPRMQASWENQAMVPNIAEK